MITILEKTKIFPIRCHNLNMAEFIGSDLKLSQFPYNYLALPLHFKKDA
jgi:hypothetical protein